MRTIPEKNDKNPYITLTTVMKRYGLTRRQIDEYLPAPKTVRNPYYRSAPPMLLWREEDVERAVRENPALTKREEKHRSREQKKKERQQNVLAYLKTFSPEDLLKRGAERDRKFVLHIGPTNSGKTYEALKTLKGSVNGLYLGPLRLLALEVSEGLNEAGYPCNLLTGEESVPVPGAQFTASTIELCDYSRRYETVVIDEAQMIADPFRGCQWFQAICLVDADTVVICGAPEIQNLLERMIRQMNSEYEVIYHERLVPLKYSGEIRSLTEVRGGDALIAFGRKKVLRLAEDLRRTGRRVSVIYGALPPVSRREEVRRFSERETDVVVATDAIGMGISLPIRRIIFTEAKKYNGDDVFPLTRSEVKQIAGRAGRYGKYNLGEVLTMDNPKLIREGLSEKVPQIKKLRIAFPEEALESGESLRTLLSLWDSLPPEQTFTRTDMRDAIFLLQYLGRVDKSVPKSFVYQLITCPVDVKREELVDYWRDCVEEILAGGQPSRPTLPEDTLEKCEIKYRAYDIYHQLMRRIGIEDDCIEEKTLLCEKINRFLKEAGEKKKKPQYHHPKRKKRLSDGHH